MHSKSIFLGGCVITWVAYQLPFLQLFWIYILVRSQSTLFGKYILVSVTFLLFLVLYQFLPYGSIIMELLIFFLSSDRLLLLLSVCIIKKKCIHMAYSHVGPQSQSQPSYGLTTGYQQVTKVQRYWQISWACGYGKRGCRLEIIVDQYPCKSD